MLKLMEVKLTQKLLLILTTKKSRPMRALLSSDLKRSRTDTIVQEMGKVVDMVKYMIQKALLAVVANMKTPRFELALSSKSASSGRDIVHCHCSG